MTKHINVTGSCHCGETSYAIDGEIIKTSHCQCEACQKATGSDRVGFLTINAESLKFTGKKPAFFNKIVEEGVDNCDAHGFWLYCAECGSRILWQPTHGDQRDILVGTLDDMTILAKA